MQVHWAETALKADRIILDIMRQRNAVHLVKGKSMVLEEMHLNAYLKQYGIEALEMMTTGAFEFMKDAPNLLHAFMSLLSGAGPDLQERLGPFHLFSQGHSRKIENVLRREIHDIAVTLFEYRYRTNSGKHTRTHHQTVLLFETQRLQLPLFNLRPEGMFHRIAKRFGYQDISFGDHPVFSESYLLRGHEEAQIRELFTEEVLNYYSRHDDLCTEGDGQRLVFYRRGQMVEPGWLEGFLEQGLDVLDLFSGTGSITYEFASRGAGSVVAVESDALYSRFIRSTCRSLGMDLVSVLHGDVFRYLIQPVQSFDIIFADPPFDHPRLTELPQMIQSSPILNSGGMLILEHPDHFTFTAHPGFRETRNYGRVNFSFFNPVG